MNKQLNHRPKVQGFKAPRDTAVAVPFSIPNKLLKAVEENYDGTGRSAKLQACIKDGLRLGKGVVLQ